MIRTIRTTRTTRIKKIIANLPQIHGSIPTHQYLTRMENKLHQGRAIVSPITKMDSSVTVNKSLQHKYRRTKTKVFVNPLSFSIYKVCLNGTNLNREHVNIDLKVC